jgi:hypothetical protein
MDVVDPLCNHQTVGVLSEAMKAAKKAVGACRRRRPPPREPQLITLDRCLSVCPTGYAGRGAEVEWPWGIINERRTEPPYRISLLPKNLHSWRWRLPGMLLNGRIGYILGSFCEGTKVRRAQGPSHG